MLEAGNAHEVVRTIDPVIRIAIATGRSPLHDVMDIIARFWLADSGMQFCKRFRPIEIGQHIRGGAFGEPYVASKDRAEPQCRRRFADKHGDQTRSSMPFPAARRALFRQFRQFVTDPLNERAIVVAIRNPMPAMAMATRYAVRVAGSD